MTKNTFGPGRPAGLSQANMQKCGRVGVKPMKRLHSSINEKPMRGLQVPHERLGVTVFV